MSLRVAASGHVDSDAHTPPRKPARCHEPPVPRQVCVAARRKLNATGTRPNQHHITGHLRPRRATITGRVNDQRQLLYKPRRREGAGPPSFPRSPSHAAFHASTSARSSSRFSVTWPSCDIQHFQCLSVELEQPRRAPSRRPLPNTWPPTTPTVTSTCPAHPPPHPRRGGGRPAPPPRSHATQHEAYLHLALPAETVGRSVVRHCVL